MKEQPLFVALIFSFCLTVENCSICCGDDLHFHGLLSQSALSLSLSFSVPGFGPKYISIIITSVKSRRPVLQKKKIQNEKAHSALQI